jgi:hypothetical protein
MASERNSLKEASSIIRGAGPGKQEFLSFCFSTMYGGLTDCAMDVARLIPYLDAEWKPMTMSIALQVPIETIRMAINELADKGIIYRDITHGADEFSVLPLTREFLSKKWHESQSFRKDTVGRLNERFSSGGSDGFLLDWPKHRRIEHLIPLAREKEKMGNMSPHWSWCN